MIFGFSNRRLSLLVVAKLEMRLLLICHVVLFKTLRRGGLKATVRL